MDSDIAFDYSPSFIIYKDGRIERLVPENIVPPSLTPENGVVSKNVVYSPEKNLSLRIYLPQNSLETDDKKKKKKLPLLVYFHGGGFIMGSAFSQSYHTFLKSAVSAANCIAVSVEYRRAPENPIPSAYEDSWDAIKWVFTHIAGTGPEDWINESADFNKVFIAGDSAGANISHHMVMRAGKEGDFEISGMVLFCPYFWSKAPIDELETRDVADRRHMEGFWEIASPNSEDGCDDPWINVVGSGSDISALGCGRVLVVLAGKDLLVRQGFGYAAKLEKSGWKGKVEIMEAKEENHVFFIRLPDSESIRQVVQRFGEFVKDETKLLKTDKNTHKRNKFVWSGYFGLFMLLVLFGLFKFQ